MPSPLLTIKRKWRSRGHGVHSPFAYRFITSVLHQSCGYYAYDEIDSLATDKADRNNARRLYRIILDLRPSEISALGNLSEASRRAVALAEAGYSPTAHSLPAMIASAESLPSCLPGSTHIIALGKSPAINVEAMQFTGRRMSIAVAFDHLPTQSFTVDI